MLVVSSHHDPNRDPTTADVKLFVGAANILAMASAVDPAGGRRPRPRAVSPTLAAAVHKSTATSTVSTARQRGSSLSSESRDSVRAASTASAVLTTKFEPALFDGLYLARSRCERRIVSRL